MAIFNEAFIDEFFFKKKKENKIKNNKSHGIITKEEASDCLKIMLSVTNKLPLIKPDIITNGFNEEYKKYISNNKNEIYIASIYKTDSKGNYREIFEDDEYGEEARKKAGLIVNYNDFSEYYDKMISKMESDVNNLIKSKYKDIEFSYEYVTYEYEYLKLISHKPKERNTDKEE